MRLQYLEAGEVVTTHGVRGEIKLLPWSDGPEFLLDFTRVLIDDTEYTVEGCRIQKSCNLLKLKGIETIESARELVGKTVFVYREDAPKDVLFVAEMIGMTVLADEEEIGKIEDVLDYPGNKVYVVRGEHVYMIPAVKEFVLSVDIDADQMRVRLIEGMRTDED